MRIPI